MFPKSIFSFEWGASALRLRVPGWARTPIQWKKAFWNHFKCENSFCKKSRNLSWVGADWSLKWMKSWKNAWNFALVEIWSGCRCNTPVKKLLTTVCNFFSQYEILSKLDKIWFGKTFRDAYCSKKFWSASFNFTRRSDSHH